MGRTTLLWSLVVLNVGIIATCLVVGFLENRGSTSWFIDYLQPGFMAGCGAFFSQLWMLSLFTAFYDPNHRLGRWLAILGVLAAAAGTLFAVHWGMYLDYLYAHPWFGQREIDSFLILGFLQRVEFSIPAVFVSLALILLIQSVCWPLRAALGLQIVFDQKEQPSGRQFGMTNMLAWMGFFAAFFYLVTLFRDNPVFYTVVAMSLLGMVATLPIGAAWLFLLGRRRMGMLLALVGIGGIGLLCFAENAAVLFVIEQVVLAGGRPPVNFWAPQIVPFNCAAALTAFVNLLILRLNGARLYSAKSSKSSPSKARAPVAIPPAGSAPLTPLAAHPSTTSS